MDNAPVVNSMTATRQKYNVRWSPTAPNFDICVTKMAIAERREVIKEHGPVRIPDLDFYKAQVGAQLVLGAATVSQKWQFKGAELRLFRVVARVLEPVRRTVENEGGVLRTLQLLCGLDEGPYKLMLDGALDAVCPTLSDADKTSLIAGLSASNRIGDVWVGALSSLIEDSEPLMLSELSSLQLEQPGDGGVLWSTDESGVDDVLVSSRAALTSAQMKPIVALGLKGPQLGASSVRLTIGTGKVTELRW